MDWLLTLAIGAIIISVIFWAAWSSTNYWKKRGIPHLNSLPIFGDTLDVVLMRKTFIENACDTYKKLEGHKYGGFMQFTKPVLMIRDPELVSTITVKEFTHFHDRGLANSEEIEPLSASLVNLTGEKWRQVRHKLTPTFTSGKLKMMFKQIVECTDEAINTLKDQKEAMEVKQHMQKYNLNVIGLVAFGLKVDAFNNKNERSNTFVKQSTSFFKPSITTLINFLIRMSSPKLGRFLRLRTMDPEVTDFFVNLVKDTIEYREKTNTKRNDFIQLMLDLKHQEIAKSETLTNSTKDGEHSHLNDEHMDAEDKELLDHLNNAPLQSKSETPVFTDMCIAAQSFLFISGGSETTATSLTFSLYELAANLHVQERVQQEIDTVLSTQEFDYSAVKEMTYLEQVIYEVLRLHPPGGVLARICTEDFILPGTDKLIEKGVLINIPVLALHTNPEYFPDPETFNPDRFADMKSIRKGTFLPFGDGPRICIAMRLAMLQMKIYLAKLLSKYNITLSDKTQLPLKMVKNSIVLNVVGGVWVHFEERQ